MDVDIVEKFLMAQVSGNVGNGSEVWKELEEVKTVKTVIEQKKTVAALRDARRENLYYLLNIKADWLELEKQPDCCNTLIKPKHELLRRLNQIKKNLQEAPTTQETADHEEAAADQHYSWFPITQEIYRWSSQAVDLEKIHGFKDKGMIMERLLVNKDKEEEEEDQSLIGIVGVAGVGKTALCQLAFNSDPVQNHFPLRIWLCFSNNKRRLDEGLEKRIFSCLGFEDEVIRKLALDKRHLQLALRHQLKRGRYLIVLDDVCAVEEKEGYFSLLFSLKSPRGRGGAIIVNSRYENYLEKMRVPPSCKINKQSPLALVDEDNSRYEKYLEKMEVPPSRKINKQSLLALVDADSCWNIFSDAVKKDGIIEQVPAELEKRRDEIVKKCEGLPLMAKMLGEIAHHVVIAKNQEN